MRHTTILFLALSIIVAGCTSEKEKSLARIHKLRVGFNVKPSEGQARLLDSAIKSFTAANPRDTATPKLLFEAADLHAHILNNPGQAAALYNQIFTDYPDHPLAAQSLFTYAYLHEVVLNNEGEARRAYNTFILKYPDHPLANDAKANLATLGRDLNDVIHEFQQRDSAQSK
jgi:outer membrane protein assembly factor BamD (BamD/ComL family)